MEFALTVPFLLLLLIGIMNFAYAFAEQMTLDNAAREAARWAVVDVDGRTCQQITDRADAAAWLADGAFTVDVDSPGSCDQPCEDSTTSDDVVVELAYTSTPLVSLPLPSFGFPGFGDVDMTGRATFRCEYS